MSESTEKARRSLGSALLGVASMAASLGAVVFLLTSDVAVAEDRPPRTEAVQAAPAAQDELAERSAQAAQVQVEEPVKVVKKAKPSPKRKRIDLGRFEGY